MGYPPPGPFTRKPMGMSRRQCNRSDAKVIAIAIILLFLIGALLDHALR